MRSSLCWGCMRLGSLSLKICGHGLQIIPGRCDGMFGKVIMAFIRFQNLGPDVLVKPAE